MACTKPRPAWKSKIPNPTGKHSLLFQPQGREPDYWIGCTKCEGCKLATRAEWALRMKHEAAMHDRNCFITLTYNQDNCPKEINREDPQKFIKRLRHHSGRPIRYFLIGEYGDKTHRPHYHACIFGEDFLGGAYNITEQLYGNAILDRIWKHGNTSIAEFTTATAMYTAGYTSKKVKDRDTFQQMSKSPPIGGTWLKQNINTLYHLGHCVLDGYEVPIPKAYLRWLDGDTKIQQIKEERELPPLLTPEQFRSKEIHYAQRAKQRMNNEKH